MSDAMPIVDLASILRRVSEAARPGQASLTSLTSHCPAESITPRRIELLLLVFSSRLSYFSTCSPIRIYNPQILHTLSHVKNSSFRSSKQSYPANQFSIQQTNYQHLPKWLTAQRSLQLWPPLLAFLLKLKSTSRTAILVCLPFFLLERAWRSCFLELPSSAGRMPRGRRSCG